MNLLRTLLFIVVGALVWRLLRKGLPSGADLSIDHRPGRPPKVGGRLAPARRSLIREFLESDLRASKPFRVRAWKVPAKPPLLKISGKLSIFQRQRIRNFLIDVMSR